MEDTWKPISEASLWDLINAAENRMTPDVTRFWEVIRIDPVKWRHHPWGDSGGGFWVVAVIGSTVVWFARGRRSSDARPRPLQGRSPAGDASFLRRTPPTTPR